MTLALSAQGLRPLAGCSPTPFIARIREQGDVPERAPEREVLLLSDPAGRPVPLGYRGYLLRQDVSEWNGFQVAYVLAPELHYLAEGDVVRIHPARRELSVLYRRASPSNSLLVTERCDNLRLMCSQPPRKQDDSWLVDELMDLIPLISPETRELGITGGEPGLLGERLILLLEQLKQWLPRTGVHVLTNGRRFSSPDFARAVGRVEHPDLMLGVPLYSDLTEEHDYVVQARGAFDETVRGILNLKRARVRVELRFVIHAQTYARLPMFAEFVSRNLRFVDHVALMGLELMGFAKTNLRLLWVDALDYQRELSEAVRTLDRAGLSTSLYNHQLCTLPAELHAFARRSISDWKNTYADECGGCQKRDMCGGFFASSSLRRSRGIRPFLG
ncbi:His-Xaa-Ser system radical SAM maturase HxsC [Myxococcus sp. K15C18031901]|uniref:His-Xaa-Ser system radical SAM maturase HxsC n=1 Tax=Myxococcus dinghuensis TaxID=2906761 RepID=UPI0020A77D99|nr:His-Xaa-Ser system radical SAM maturase HxsC [Myxococcus dinghuensis]MCP3105490.1 His-Xaa-Ser system radical SAM maturase HxsC [Myxococcus dinghuensis]